MKEKELLCEVKRMGKKVLPFYLFTFLLLSACQQNDGKCYIEGTVKGEQYYMALAVNVLSTKE